MADLMRLYSHMRQEYQQAVQFFGEDPARMRIDDFFGAFAAFIADFQVRTLLCYVCVFVWGQRGAGFDCNHCGTVRENDFMNA